MTLAIIYGGEGYEHSVSMLGFQNLFPILEKNYRVLPIFIDTCGEFWLENKRVFPTYGGFADSGGEVYTVDCAFPLLHGDMGEDGVVQSALALGKIPFIGCTPTVGALCRDKFTVKAVANSLGIPTLPARLISRDDEIALPCFIKPSGLGSSIGAGAARNMGELQFALENAFRYTDRVMAEPLLESKRELECGYFGVKGKEIFTNAGEILSNDAFYDYDSKYGGGTKTATVADVSPEINQKIKEYSARLVSALGVRHISRIDFFLSGEEIYFNEINTMPGFTAESLYPRMLAEHGIDVPKMVEMLIGDIL